MPRQSIEEAFSLLEIPLDSKEEEIKKAYKAKSKKYHPDKMGGDHDMQSKLNEAFEIAIDFLHTKTALVPISVGKSLERVERSLVAQRAFTKANELASLTKKRKTKTIQTLKTITFVVGGISGLLALIGSNNLLALFTDSEIANIILILLMFEFGIAGLFFQFRVNQIQNRIDSYMEILSNRSRCASWLAESLGYKDYNDLSKGEILSIAEDNLVRQSERGHSFLFNIYTSLTTEELLELILLKAEEHGIATPIEQEHVTPDNSTRYKIQFKPSIFKPKPEPKPKEKPLSIKEIRTVTIFGAILFSLFASATVYLAVALSTLWSILTGVFAISGASLLLAGISDLVKFRKR